MASGFFALLDDISVLMDDVATMGKLATKKTAGILGDDLAVNADKASGFVSSREVPVLMAIMKGSFFNKLIILPIAFLLSAYYPIAITLILILGGFYLAYEGAEKIYEYFFHRDHEIAHTIERQDLTQKEVMAQENDKVRSAILTDFILSVEIVIIALGTVLKEPLLNQILVVSFVAMLATIGVYGIVALIVRMDDYGFRLIEKSRSTTSFRHRFGNYLVQALPKIIRALAVIGTIALLLVSGGIFVHNIHVIHDLVADIPLPGMVKEFVVGLMIGLITVIIVNTLKKLFSKKAAVQKS